ncbi:MAG: hypothetical protein EXS16_21130 [Gemmataceae bacterium]|nr:hypothetical protein [Gemmataceae bacterium]
MRKPLLTLILSFFGFATLTGCGLFESCCNDRCGTKRVPNRTTPYRPVFTPPTSAPTKGSVVKPPVVPDRVPSAPKFLPTIGKRGPNPVDAKIEIAPTAIETPDIFLTESIIKPATNTDTPKAVKLFQGSVQPDSVVPEKAANVKSVHADGYQTLVGQVHQFRKTWRLRYASIEQNDPHGGSIILESDGDLSALRDGSTIRVRGILIPATDRTTGASYRVQNFEIVK